MSTWAPSLVTDQYGSIISRHLRAYVTPPTTTAARSHEVRSGRVVDPYDAAAQGACSVGAGAGQGPDLQLRVLALVGLLLGQVGADDAEQEAHRDRDDAGVLQREPVEVDVREHRRLLAG